jgi:hypothetical protein
MNPGLPGTLSFFQGGWLGAPGRLRQAVPRRYRPVEHILNCDRPGVAGASRWREDAALSLVGRRPAVLMTIFVLLLILWLLGVVTSYTLGGFIHLLLLIAIAVVLIRIIQGRRPI